ncbi:hypothetical protein [Micromonospora sp. WMMD964]|uniref:hypothetical protein n=1 Tax=Micromonospora sp. WMMD964 TaxID=3016091 RepID=UPI00249B54EE|nr:hypothetical protein [Micromonospora sp. WMMD964]WFE99051.1 hypothetical protein O7616_19295 [Micromonospora sp. WMMD964]
MTAVGHGTNHEPEAPQEPAPPAPAPLEPAPPEPAGEAVPLRWSTGSRLLVAAAAVVLLLGAAAVAVIVADPGRRGMTYTGAPDVTRPDGTRPDGTRPDGTRPGDVGRAGGVADPDAADGRPGTGAADGRTLTAPVAGRRTGTFVLADGLSSFDLRVADLGDDLYRITSPAGSGVVGRPVVSGETVRLDLADSGERGPGAVRVLLNERVTWRLHLVGGVSRQVLDLTRARLLGVELAGGSSRTEILLPAITEAGTDNGPGTGSAPGTGKGPGSPEGSGILTVRLTGGTSQLDIRLAGETPVRVRVGAGAGSVALDHDHWDGVGAGTVLGTPGWDRAAQRLYLDLVAGADSVTVSARAR